MCDGGQQAYPHSSNTSWKIKAGIQRQKLAAVCFRGLQGKNEGAQPAILMLKILCFNGEKVEAGKSQECE